jgi:hypothetical protein
MGYVSGADYILYPDNGGISGPGYSLPFTLQLQEPFSAGFRAGFSLSLLSVTWPEALTFSLQRYLMLD